MNKQARINRLSFGRIPRWVRVYDNGGETVDRYTVVFTHAAVSRKFGGRVPYLAMNGSPYAPQGFCQHGDTGRPCDTMGVGWAPAIGRKCHLGRRIEFIALPLDCQKAVWRDYADYWDIPNYFAKSPASITVEAG
jgi:hypothetical protein